MALLERVQASTLSGVSLPVGGGLELEQCLENSIDPSKPQMQQMIEALFPPAHLYPCSWDL